MARTKQTARTSRGHPHRQLATLAPVDTFRELSLHKRKKLAALLAERIAQNLLGWSTRVASTLHETARGVNPTALLLVPLNLKVEIIRLLWVDFSSVFRLCLVSSDFALAVSGKNHLEMLLGIMCGCSYARTNELSRLDRGRSAQLTKDGMFATENLDSQTPLAIVTGVVASVNQLQELQGGADSTLLLSGARVNRADGYSYPDSYTVQPQRSDGIILNHTLQAEDDPMRDGCDSERNKVIDRETMILTPFVTKDGRKNEDLRWRTPNHSCDSSNCELLIFGIETFSHVFKCLDGGSASTEMWLRICQPMLRYQTLAEEPVSNQQLMLLMVKPNSQVECGSEVLIQYCDPDRHRIQRSQLGYCSTVCGCNQAALPHFMNNELIKEGAGFGSLCQSMVSVSKEWLQAKDILRTAVAAMHTANTRLQESATELVSRGAGSALGDLTHNASSSHPKDDEIDNGKILILATESDSDEMVMRSLCGLENHHDY